MDDRAAVKHCNKNIQMESNLVVDQGEDEKT